MNGEQSKNRNIYFTLNVAHMIKLQIARCSQSYVTRYDLETNQKTLMADQWRHVEDRTRTTAHNIEGIFFRSISVRIGPRISVI